MKQIIIPHLCIFVVDQVGSLSTYILALAIADCMYSCDF